MLSIIYYSYTHRSCNETAGLRRSEGIESRDSNIWEITGDELHNFRPHSDVRLLSKESSSWARKGYK
jgi:hypothetical protein